MRGIRWSLLFVLAVSAPQAARAQTASAKRQIAALEDSWIQALIKRDSAAFTRLLAPDFVYTEDDSVYTKAQLISTIMTGSDTVTSGRNEDLVVHVYGNTAVATGWLILVGRGPSGGGASEVRYRYTDTWVKLSGRWRVVAAQDYRKR